MEEKLLTFKEAQQYLRVSRSTMFRLLTYLQREFPGSDAEQLQTQLLQSLEKR